MVDPVSSNLGRMLADEITPPPVVVILRIPLVGESSQQNAEMLGSFCVFNNVDVRVRTASDQPYRVTEIQVAFILRIRHCTTEYGVLRAQVPYGGL